MITCPAAEAQASVMQPVFSGSIEGGALMRKRLLPFTSIMLLGAWSGIGGLGGQDAKNGDTEEYEFAEDTNRWAMVIQGRTESIGKLDAVGNFNPDKGYFQLRRGQHLSSVPGFTLINPVHEGAYEFRSGRLIPGDIDKDGNFIPTVGGEIIDFKDYRYGPKVPKIYNLPGKFVKKKRRTGRSDVTSARSPQSGQLFLDHIDGVVAMRETQLLFATVMFLTACGSINNSNEQDAKTGGSNEHEFVEDTNRWVVLIQGETESIGKLDSAGNFVPDKRWFQLKKRQLLDSAPPRTLINRGNQKGVYEFRSGRLITGDIDEDGNFVPTVGGTVIDFKDYHYSPDAAKIYNLPGTFVKKEKKDGQK